MKQSYNEGEINEQRKRQIDLLDYLYIAALAELEQPFQFHKADSSS